MLGGKGRHIILFKMVFTVHYDFENWSQNQHFQRMILVGRDSLRATKRALCTLLTMLTILDDPLSSQSNWVNLNGIMPERCTKKLQMPQRSH